MAALAHNPHSFPANDGGLPPPTDPFWQATPRSTLTSQELELLMAAEQVSACRLVVNSREYSTTFGMPNMHISRLSSAITHD